MTERRPLQSVKDALTRATTGLSSASNLLSKADSDKVEVRRRLAMLAVKCLDLRSEIHGLLAQVNSVESEVRRG